MKGSYLGPCFTNESVHEFLASREISFRQLASDELTRIVARHLKEGKVVGWFQGRMEFGPRALGGRSIIGDARSPKMQSVMNLKIK